ncbi:MAG: hypothetical protein ACI8VC_002677 [Candidatus Endobugula sp.]
MPELVKVLIHRKKENMDDAMSGIAVNVLFNLAITGADLVGDSIGGAQLVDLL